MGGFIIPDSGNVVGSDAVMRQPEQVNPFMDGKVQQIDLAPVMDSAQDIAKAYNQMVEGENNAYLQQAYNDFDEHMASFENDLQNSRKGYNAKDIYTSIKDESYRYYNDMTGEPKDDGKVRPANADAKAALQQYIDRRQKSFISSSASYEANQMEVAQKATFEAGITNAATAITTAQTNQQIADGMANIARINSVQLRGMPSDYVRLETGKLQDAAAAGYISQLASVNPVQAVFQMKTNPNVSNYLTSETRSKLSKSIQDSYEARQLGRAMDGQVDELSPDYIKEIYNTQNDSETEFIRNRIVNDAREKKAVQDQKAADTFAQLSVESMNKVYDANTPEEKFRAEVALAELSPEDYDFMAQSNDMLAKTEAAQRIIEQNNILAPSNKISLNDISDAVGIDIPISQTNAADARMAALPEGERRIVEQYYNDITARIANNGDRMSVYDKIANGEKDIRKLGIERFDGNTRKVMISNISAVREYDALSAELRQGGVNLDKEISASGYVDFKNNPAKQIAVKQKLTEFMRDYKKTNKSYPTEDQRQRLITQSIASSKTKSDEINEKLEVRTAGSVMDMAIMSDTKTYKTKDTTYTKQYDYWSKRIDDVIDDGSLTQLQRNSLRQNREAIIQAKMSGTPLPILQDVLGEY